MLRAKGGNKCSPRRIIIKIHNTGKGHITIASGEKEKVSYKLSQLNNVINVLRKKNV